jgi:hypothetical protein
MSIDMSMVTMVTIEWIMFELANNLAIPKRLYKEIIDVIGGQDQIMT